MSYDYDRDDPGFVDDLYESQKYVDLAAGWLRGFGYGVKVNKLHVRPDSSRMAEYADGGDLECTGLFAGKEQTVCMEVKHRKTLSFTNSHDYPFSTAIVDVAHHWDKADPKPFAYLIFNAAVTHIMIVDGDTSEHWEKQERYDAKKKRQRTFLECPVARCRFYRFRGWETE